MGMDKNKVLNTVASGKGNHLGDTIWWGLEKVLCDPIAFEEIAVAVGLPDDMRPKAPTDAEAFARICRQPTKAGTMIRQVKGADQGTMAFEILRVTQETTTRNRYDHAASITIDKKTGVVTAITPDGSTNTTAADIEAEYMLTRQKIQTSDFSSFLVNAIHRLQGFALRDSGGVYWIPQVHATTLRRIQAAMEQMVARGEAVGAMLDIMPTMHTDEGQGALSRVATRTVLDEIQTLHEEIDKFDDKTRESTMQARLENFDEILAKADLYEAVLGMTTQGIRERVGNLKAMLQDKMNLRTSK